MKRDQNNIPCWMGIAALQMVRTGAALTLVVPPMAVIIVLWRMFVG